MDTDLLVLFEDGLQRFNREHYSAAQLVARTREGPDPSGRLLADMAAMGWFDLLRAESGDRPAAASVAHMLPLFRAAGEGLWQEPLASVLGASAVVAARTESIERRESLLDGLTSGLRPLAYAAREIGDGWKRAAIATLARPTQGAYSLDGAKIALPDVDQCAGFVVLATDAGTQRPGYFLVMKEAAGVELFPCRSVEGRGMADLELRQASAEYLCSGDHAGRAEGWAAILAAAEAVGIMRGANQDTVAYLRERRQFGRSLLGFQVLQHRLVEMHMLERETDALLRTTAEAYDAGAPALERRLLALRAQASRALRQITREAVQMHGGMGVTQETRVSHYYRRALMLDSLYGSEDWALEQMAGD